MRAAIYSRKSKFTGKGESIENQLQLCREYCAKENFEVVCEYEDEGFSGKNMDRPRFQEMIQAAKKKKFDLIVCYRLDRISRNIADFANLIEQLNKLNVGFISVNERFDTSSPLGRAMMNIAAVFAQLERETIAERIKDNMMQLARTGRWLGGKTPTGFKSEPIVYSDINGKERKMFKLIPLEEEQDLVRILFQKYVELNGIHKLEGYCFENNLKSKQGNFFDKSALVFILTNPVYAIADEYTYEYCVSKGMDIACDKNDFDGDHGLMVFNKRYGKYASNKKDKSEWVVSVGLHQGIISSKDWIQVQNMMEVNSAKAPRDGTSEVSLLTPLLVCGDCGTTMRIAYKFYKGELRSHYYKCRLKERSRGTQCKSANVNGKLGEEEVIELLKKIALNQSAMAEKLKTKQSTLKKAVKGSESKLGTLHKKIKDCEESIKNLTLQLSQNEKSTAAKYIVKEIESFDKQLNDFRKQITNVEDEKEDNLMKQLNTQYVQESLQYFAANSDNMTFEQKKRYIHNIIEKITWDGKLLHVKIYEID